MTRRASICFIAPGHTLLSTAGSTRNILATADALSEWADVSVVFRNIAERISSPNFRIEQIESGRAELKAHVTMSQRADSILLLICRICGDSANTPQGRRPTLTSFLKRDGGFRVTYAVNLRLEGIPTILVENDVRVWTEPIRSPRGASEVGHSCIGAVRCPSCFSTCVPCRRGNGGTQSGSDGTSSIIRRQSKSCPLGCGPRFVSANGPGWRKKQAWHIRVKSYNALCWQHGSVP